jgi:hypothetical protein
VFFALARITRFSYRPESDAILWQYRLIYGEKQIWACLLAAMNSQKVCEY